MAALIEQSVLLQSENLWSHAAVAEGLAAESLEVHGWLYDIESGDVLIYHQMHEMHEMLGRFVRL